MWKRLVLVSAPPSSIYRSHLGLQWWLSNHKWTVLLTMTLRDRGRHAASLGNHPSLTLPVPNMVEEWGKTPTEHTDSLNSTHGDKRGEYIKCRCLRQFVIGSTSGYLHWASAEKGKRTGLNPCATSLW